MNNETGKVCSPVNDYELINNDCVTLPGTQRGPGWLSAGRACSGHLCPPQRAMERGSIWRAQGRGAAVHSISHLFQASANGASAHGSPFYRGSFIEPPAPAEACRRPGAAHPETSPLFTPRSDHAYHRDWCAGLSGSHRSIISECQRVC